MTTKIGYVGLVATGLIAAVGCSSGLPSASNDDAGGSEDGGGLSDDGGLSSVADSSNGSSSSSSVLASGTDAGSPDTGNATTGLDASTEPTGDSTTPVDSNATTAADSSSSADSSPLDGGNAPTNDSSTLGDAGSDEYAALGPSCISNLWSTYIQRTDGALLWEGPPEEPIVDTATGLPLAGVVNVADGQNHGCAALSDGTAQCWQLNTSGNSLGQLGNGTTATSTVLYRGTPVLTAANTPLTDVLSVASAKYSNVACAVTSGGALYCWGDLTWVVNNGTTLYSGYAQPITTDGMTPLTGVIQAAVGPATACALVKPSGASTSEVFCWGYNGAGELGQGSTVTSQYPVQVLGITDPTKIGMSAEGSDATVCVLDAGNVLCWGDNGGGAAGVDSTTNPIQSPSLVLTQSSATLSAIADYEPGTIASAVLLNSGTIWTWGNGATTYAANYGITNVLAVGFGGGYGNYIRYLTSDGIYHSAMNNVTVNCGAL